MSTSASICDKTRDDAVLLTCRLLDETTQVAGVNCCPMVWKLSCNGWCRDWETGCFGTGGLNAGCLVAGGSIASSGIAVFGMETLLWICLHYLECLAPRAVRPSSLGGALFNQLLGKLVCLICTAWHFPSLRRFSQCGQPVPTWLVVGKPCSVGLPPSGHFGLTSWPWSLHCMVSNLSFCTDSKRWLGGEGATHCWQGSISLWWIVTLLTWLHGTLHLRWMATITATSIFSLGRWQWHVRKGRYHYGSVIQWWIFWYVLWSYFRNKDIWEWERIGNMFHRFTSRLVY